MRDTRSTTILEIVGHERKATAMDLRHDRRGWWRARDCTYHAHNFRRSCEKKALEKNDVLMVSFLGGTSELHSRVLNAARQWLVEGINLRIEPAVSGQKAQIRIAFDPRGGAWSYIGTDSLLVHPNQPTMNLGWATLETPEKDFNSVVIHEWGHALGLLHEHNHPEAKINWNKDKVRKDLSNPPNNWDNDTIESNVFAKFSASNVITTDFDNASVMIYNIPESWTTDGKSFMPSWKLSKGDKETIQRLYR